MWQWIKSFFKKSYVDRLDLYQPHERKIFTYFDGEKLVKADPMTLWQRWMDKEPVLSMDAKATRGDVPDNKFKAQAHANMLKAIRYIYNIKPFEEGGLMQYETTELHASFAQYCFELKKNSNTSQTNVGEVSPSTEPLPGIVLTTENTSPSGSTAKETSTDSPTPLPPESV
jgi:hypothetical protein